MGRDGGRGQASLGQFPSRRSTKDWPIDFNENVTCIPEGRMHLAVFQSIPMKSFMKDIPLFSQELCFILQQGTHFHFQSKMIQQIQGGLKYGKLWPLYF